MQTMPIPKGRILYSEDDPDSPELLCLILNKEGFETICPDTSADVLRIAKSEKFDAYLLDTWTPGISGLEICKRIRAVDSQTPIIFYSGAAYEADKEAARLAGAQAYITKPAPFEEVLDAIRSVISTRLKASSATWLTNQRRFHVTLQNRRLAPPMGYLLYGNDCSRSYKASTGHL